MLREDMLNSLYAKRSSPAEFNFESLRGPNIHSLLSEYDMSRLYDICTSVEYSSKVEKKIKAVREILRPRGFEQFANGTNRMGFRFLEDKNIILKVAYKRSGLDNGFREMRNQELLKPFCTKTFEVHPSGIVSLHERVLPITNKAEFISVIDDVFDVLTCLVGKYVLEDVGTKYFMNWGIRSGFGPVILDYPDLYELDGQKLYCNRPIYPNTKFPVCKGLIDYDDGFNMLVCTKCGKEYRASELEKARENKLIIIEGDVNMKVKMWKDGVCICESDDVTDVITAPQPVKKIRPREMNVRIVRYDEEENIVSKNTVTSIEPELTPAVEEAKHEVVDDIKVEIVNTEEVKSKVEKGNTDSNGSSLVNLKPEKEDKDESSISKDTEEALDLIANLRDFYKFTDEDLMNIVNILTARTNVKLHELPKQHITQIFKEYAAAKDEMLAAEARAKKSNVGPINPKRTVSERDRDDQKLDRKKQSSKKYPDSGVKSRFIPESDDMSNY